MSWEQIAAIAAAAVAVFWVLGAHNRLVALRTQIGQAWAKVDEAQRQRGATAVVPLVSALREPLASEQGALDALLLAQAQSAAATQAMAARPVAAGPAVEWIAAEATLTATASRVHALVEQHPDLQQSGDVAAALASWHDWQPRLLFARQLYNETAAVYDAALLQRPTRWLRRLFHFEAAGRL